MTTETIDQRAERLVRQEVNVCLSGLVSTLMKGNSFINPGHKNNEGFAELSALAEQAFELCTPVQDWEEAARQAGWTLHASFSDHMARWSNKAASDYVYEDARACCKSEGIDPYEWEIFEHWSVSQWLADRLIEQGERVDTDFAGLCVWGRTTTGQGIAQDSVIHNIVAKLYAAEAA